MVLIPAASSAGTYDYWQKIDKKGEQDVSMVDSLLGVLNSSVKIEMLVFLVGITAFMALRSPLTPLIVPDARAWRAWLSQDSNHWGMVWHDSAILMPVLFLAMADGVRRSRGIAPTLARLVREGRRPRLRRDRRGDDPAPAAARPAAPGHVQHRRAHRHGPRGAEGDPGRAAAPGTSLRTCARPTSSSPPPGCST
ncbi:hypothetical protein SMICM17S_10970 [Streptomyces microflavus]